MRTTPTPENTEYQSAKIEQEINEARIADLEDKLARSEVINASRIFWRHDQDWSYRDTHRRKEGYGRSFGEPEAEPHKGLIVVNSPIARALIGKTQGDTVEVDGPGGARIYNIKNVEWV